jgi:hypothetical protein
MWKLLVKCEKEAGVRLFIAGLLVVVLSSLAFAEVTTVRIPGQDWVISFNSPPLSGKQTGGNERNYAFRANSGRFNVSLFVESPQGAASHEDCYKFYWTKGSSGGPPIDKKTISVKPGDRFYRVQYDIIMEFKGHTIRHRNVNYYAAFGGKWIDVHISIIDPTDPDEQIFVAFDESLNFGRSSSK